MCLLAVTPEKTLEEVGKRCPPENQETRREMSLGSYPQSEMESEALAMIPPTAQATILCHPELPGHEVNP